MVFNKGLKHANYKAINGNVEMKISLVMFSEKINENMSPLIYFYK